jgi:hypothetical protein
VIAIDAPPPRLPALAALIVVLVALSAATPGRADFTLAKVARPTPVATWTDRRPVTFMAWSEFDPASGGYRLTVRHVHLNQTEPVPIAPRAVPFDVDLGPGPGGTVVATYSRCAREPTLQGGFAVLPIWASGRGCDLYQFDFTSGTETKLAWASSPRASEFLPSTWRGRVAFARVYEGREGRRGIYPYLYTRRVGGKRSSKRQPGGPRGNTGLPGPTALDLYGRRLTLAWTRSTGGLQPGHSEIRLDTLGGQHAVLDSQRAGLAGRILVSPGVVKGRVHWAQQMLDPDALGRSAPEAFYRRRRISSGRTQEASVPLDAQFVLSLAPGRGGELIYGRVGLVGRGAEMACAAPSSCEVRVSGPLDWRARQPFATPP